MVVQKLYRTGRVVGQRQFAIVGGMIETAIHPATHIEWDVLIATAIVDTLSVLVLQLEGLPAEIHLAESLTCSHEALIGFALKADGGSFCLVCRGATSAYKT